MRRQVGLALRDEHYRVLRAMADTVKLTPPEMAECLIVGALEGAGAVARQALEEARAESDSDQAGARS